MVGYRVGLVFNPLAETGGTILMRTVLYG